MKPKTETITYIKNGKEYKVTKNKVQKTKEDMSTDIWGQARGSSNSPTIDYNNQHLIGNDPEMYNFNVSFPDGMISIKGLLILSIDGISKLRNKDANPKIGNAILNMATNFIVENRELVKP